MFDTLYIEFGSYKTKSTWFQADTLFFADRSLTIKVPGWVIFGGFNQVVFACSMLTRDHAHAGEKFLKLDPVL